MSTTPTRPAPLNRKPRKMRLPCQMVAYYTNLGRQIKVTDDGIYALQNADGFTWDNPRVRPVLVTDLSPESVERMVCDLSCVMGKHIARPCDIYFISLARVALASLGIKAAKGGRK